MLALGWLRQAAVKGIGDADYALAVAYAGGCGVPKDAAESARRKRKAAEEGFAPAQYEVATQYERNGNYTDAAKWYLKAALQGRSEAQAGLGKLFEDGLGVPQDNAKAAEWYRRAAEHDSDAQGRNELGMLYADGRGVRQDYVEAYKWFALAHADTNLRILSAEISSEQIAEAQRRTAEWGKTHHTDTLHTP